MIEEIVIKKMEDLHSVVFEQQENEHNHRLRSTFFYRGMSRTDYRLVTSLDRNCGSKKETLEHYLLESFAKYVSIIDPSVTTSEWRAMMVGQHHGLPTRLLDWTRSFPIALHFATTESDLSEMNKNDCAVWRFDAKEINALLPSKYKAVLEENKTFIFTLKGLETVAKDVKHYDRDMESCAFVTVEPPSIDQRIVNQYSFFTIMPKGIDDMITFLDENTKNTKKYIIDKELRWDIRDTLDQWNLNERMIYPGKDGIATWLKRHYYVQKDLT